MSWVRLRKRLTNVAQSHNTKGTGRMRNMHYVGLDVHYRSINVAVADESKVYTVVKIQHHVSRLKKVLAKIASKKKIHVVYEAGPTGYGLCREVRTSGYKCEVIAPGLIPTMRWCTGENSAVAMLVRWPC